MSRDEILDAECRAGTLDGGKFGTCEGRIWIHCTTVGFCGLEYEHTDPCTDCGRILTPLESLEYIAAELQGRAWAIDNGER